MAIQHDFRRHAARLFDDDRPHRWLTHETFEDGELPLYSVCDRCSRPIRIDRRDLIEEHRAACRPPAAA